MDIWGNIWSIVTKNNQKKITESYIIEIMENDAGYTTSQDDIEDTLDISWAEQILKTIKQKISDQNQFHSIKFDDRRLCDILNKCRVPPL